MNKEERNKKIKQLLIDYTIKHTKTKQDAINALNNTAKIVAITKPILEGVETADEFIAYAARVSNPSNQMNNETSQKLIQYLIKHKHWSPFEVISITMEINTTRDIARQILRHRSFSFQEFSQRYADPTQSLGFVTREARLQDKKNRQNSIENNNDELENEWQKRQEYILNEINENYKWATKNGIAKEQARAILPEGLTKSRLYMAGTLRSFWHFVQVRHHPTAQKEVRLVAESVSNELKKHFPSVKELLTETIENNYKK